MTIIREQIFQLLIKIVSFSIFYKLFDPSWSCQMYTFQKAFQNSTFKELFKKTQELKLAFFSLEKIQRNKN